ncbi:MAG TPA: acyl-CoA dehydrogenase family protein [Acidimicrobiia bacterium]|nr:acyl-CoA dehydrogenase family protein [Acidimicrobiia bacterium]
MPGFALLPIDADASEEQARAVVRDWANEHVPAEWRRAAAEGGPAAVRKVRSRADYEAWYPTFADAGLVVPTWPREYGGLGVKSRVARAVDNELAPLNLGRLNVLGLNLAGPTIMAWGTDEQKARFLPPIVRNEEVWCQLFSEPGAGSDLASLATRAVRDGDEWVVTGQKVWSTWAHFADFGMLIARTDPHAQKRRGITYFLLDMHQPGVEVRPLKQITGEADFNEVFLSGARVPDANRIGEPGEGWKVANSTLSGERQMISGPGSGGVDRIGGSSVERLVQAARDRGLTTDPTVRQRIVALWSEEKIRRWTNARVRDNARAGRVGPESSVGKVHSGELNQRTQELAVDLLGPEALAWDPATVDPDADGGLPRAVHGFLRSRANTIEGGTSEVNRNVLGERVLGLPREPDPYRESPWEDVPRN